MKVGGPDRVSEHSERNSVVMKNDKIDNPSAHHDV
jgi:hypothetical protein